MAKIRLDGILKSAGADLKGKNRLMKNVPAGQAILLLKMNTGTISTYEIIPTQLSVDNELEKTPTFLSGTMVAGDKTIGNVSDLMKEYWKNTKDFSFKRNNAPPTHDAEILTELKKALPKKR